MKNIKRILIVISSSLLLLSFVGCQNSSSDKASTPSKSTVGDSSKTQEIKEKSKIKYKNYSNARFGFTLSYPDIFIESKESDNGDGITLKSSDDLYTLKIWGSNNINNSTGKSLLDEAKNRVAYISSEKAEDNFYKLEYGGGGDGKEIIFYECGCIVGDKILNYVISYPKDEKDKFTEVITRMTDELINGKS